MSAGVEFDEDKFSYGTRPAPRPVATGAFPPSQANFAGARMGGGQANASYSAYGGDERGMAGWLMRHGFAKSPNAARGVMIGLVLLNITITIAVIIYAM